MKKRILSLFLAVVMVVGMAPLALAAETIPVYVTIVNQGNVVVAQQKVETADQKGDGFDVDDVLYAAHEMSYAGGAEAGYGSAVGDYGLYITKLWGDVSGCFGYWLNHGSCWSLADPVRPETMWWHLSIRIPPDGLTPTPDLTGTRLPFKLASL